MNPPKLPWYHTATLWDSHCGAATYDAWKRKTNEGTKVKNALSRWSDSAYARCSSCNRYYTHLGIARYWPKCKATRQNSKWYEI